MRILVALGLLVSMAFSGCAGGEQHAATTKTVEARPVLALGMAAIEGYVVDQELRPIAAARVEIAALGLSWTTDQDGYYYSGSIAPGRYDIGATAPGHVSHAVQRSAVEGEIGLVVFVLRAIPVPDTYTISEIKKGFLACALVVGPPGGEGDSVLSAVELECGVPRTGGANAVQGRALPIEAQDRSVQRWQLDQPMAAWTSASLLTRWTASHDLVRIFWTDFGVDGCTDPERTFGRLTGTSPLRQPVSADQLAKVLLATEGTTCGSPGERCDAESCVLFSRVRPAPHALGHALVRAGAALQQAFEQELSATFKPVPDAEGQTLK